MVTQVIYLYLIFVLQTFYCYADQNLNTNFSANILDGTCQISIANGGQVTLPVVTKDYFISNGEFDKYTPTDFENGKMFSILITDCPVSGNGTPNRIHFTFKPQSGQYPTSTKQVFINEISSAAGGADNTGVVIFSDQTKKNVLNEDGSSDVIYNVDGSEYLTNYVFDARYQNYGNVTSGKISSHVQVSVTYE